MQQQPSRRAGGSCSTREAVGAVGAAQAQKRGTTTKQATEDRGTASEGTGLDWTGGEGGPTRTGGVLGSGWWMDEAIGWSAGIELVATAGYTITM
jgi:hypothetical protein